METRVRFEHFLYQTHDPNSTAAFSLSFNCSLTVPSTADWTAVVTQNNNTKINISLNSIDSLISYNGKN